MIRLCFDILDNIVTHKVFGYKHSGLMIDIGNTTTSPQAQNSNINTTNNDINHTAQYNHSYTNKRHKQKNQRKKKRDANHLKNSLFSDNNNNSNNTRDTTPLITHVDCNTPGAACK